MCEVASSTFGASVVCVGWSGVDSAWLGRRIRAASESVRFMAGLL